MNYLHSVSHDANCLDFYIPILLRHSTGLRAEATSPSLKEILAPHLHVSLNPALLQPRCKMQEEKNIWEKYMLSSRFKTASLLGKYSTSRKNDYKRVKSEGQWPFLLSSLFFCLLNLFFFFPLILTLLTRYHLLPSSPKQKFRKHLSPSPHSVSCKSYKACLSNISPVLIPSSLYPQVRPKVSYYHLTEWTIKTQFGLENK